jgi:FlaA1/EpsC-like NDP-sugar epimerase
MIKLKNNMNYTKTISYLNKLNIVPRWFILLLDIAASIAAICFSLFITNNLVLNTLDWREIFSSIIMIGVLNVLVFVSLRTYRGIVRFTGLQDGLRVFLAVIFSSFTLFLTKFIYIGEYSLSFKSNVVIVLYSIFCFVFMLGYRVCIKYLFEVFRNHKSVKKNVVIYGAGLTGMATKRVLSNDTRTTFYISAFIDDDNKKNSKSLDGVSIISFEEFKTMVNQRSIDELIISIFSLSSKRKNELVDFCLDHEINVLTVPPYAQWADGSFAPKQLKNIKIEDLLEREPIILDNEQIKKQVKGKRILVTGAAGSIGSEIVRQLSFFSPEMIIICDQAETPLHDLELEMQYFAPNIQCIPYLTSVNHLSRMDALFLKFKPHHVYHAAAYKHVPMMEFNPVEALRVNVIGTKLVSDLSIKYNVERFVMVSTDKAVNPTNVMGASKRLAEMYVQGLSSLSGHHTKFITTRFGNVLGSNGSVILRFKDQIENGGPVTVTHPNIMRYFMTIPEACQLVLEAGSMGNGGEVFVFDMGSPVKIADLAKKMIRLYGMIPNIDINITYTGLRPGEKLYEELLAHDENTIKTYHNKIMIAKLKSINFSEINKSFIEFEELIYQNSNESLLVSKMKLLIPEYISNNSVFEHLDTVKLVVVNQ